MNCCGRGLIRLSSDHYEKCFKKVVLVCYQCGKTYRINKKGGANDKISTSR